MIDFINVEDINDVILVVVVFEFEQMVDWICELIGMFLEQIIELEWQVFVVFGFGVVYGIIYWD